MRLLVFIFCLALFAPVFAQNTGSFEEMMERLLETQDGESDYQDFIDRWAAYRNNPINLNKCQATDLLNLGILTVEEANAIINHREKYSDFIDILELQVCNLPIEKIGYLKFFVRVDNFYMSNATQYKQQLFITCQIQSPQKLGFLNSDSTENRYYGNALRQVVRYRGTSGRFVSYGATSEKDAGEPFLTNKNRLGFDYYSAYFIYQNPYKTINKILIGDYQANFGQGLTLGSGLGFRKSALTLNTMKNSTGLTAYRSLNENQFLRGAAISAKLKQIDLSAFASRLHVDANIVGNTDTLEQDFETGFTSLQTTGLHRKPSEWNDKDALLMTQLGYNLKTKHHHFTIGHTASFVQFAGNLIKNDALYKKYDFDGNRYSKFGVNHSFYLGNFLFFGEATLSSNKKKAWVEGVLFSLGKSLDFTFFYRDIDAGFIGLQSNVFAESSNASNEKGMYSGFSFKPNKKLEIVGYSDYYSFPWLTFSAQNTTVGSDFLSEIRYKFTKKVIAYCRFKHEKKEQSASENLPQKILVESISNRFRFNIDITTNSFLKLRTRIETNSYKIGNNQPTFGNLIFQDITYRFHRIPLKLTMRFAISQIDDFNNRIYTYENDVPLSYSIPFYQYNSVKNYALLNYSISNNIDFWLKFAHEFKATNGFGSGLDYIYGNTRNDLKFQLQIQL